ncbi:hypothetical protein Tco_0412320 [Tanacetum coccineum]
MEGAGRLTTPPCFTVKSWLSPMQTALGKGLLKSVVKLDSLLKTLWLSMPMFTLNALSIPDANGSEAKEFQDYKVTKELKFIKENIKESGSAATRLRLVSLPRGCVLRFLNSGALVSSQPKEGCRVRGFPDCKGRGFGCRNSGLGCVGLAVPQAKVRLVQQVAPQNGAFGFSFSAARAAFGGFHSLGWFPPA